MKYTAPSDKFNVKEYEDLLERIDAALAYGTELERPKKRIKKVKSKRKDAH